MLTPVKPVSFEFTSDNTSSALVFDLSTAPIGIDFQGSRIAGVQSLAVTTTGAGVSVPTVTPTIDGQVLTLTFATPPLRLDTNSALVVYTVNFLLQFLSIFTS